MDPLLKSAGIILNLVPAELEPTSSIFPSIFKAQYRVRAINPDATRSAPIYVHADSGNMICHAGAIISEAGFSALQALGVASPLRANSTTSRGADGKPLAFKPLGEFSTTLAICNSTKNEIKSFPITVQVVETYHAALDVMLLSNNFLAANQFTLNIGPLDGKSDQSYIPEGMLLATSAARPFVGHMATAQEKRTQAATDGSDAFEHFFRGDTGKPLQHMLVNSLPDTTPELFDKPQPTESAIPHTFEAGEPVEAMDHELEYAPVEHYTKEEKDDLFAKMVFNLPMDLQKEVFEKHYTSPSLEKSHGEKPAKCPIQYIRRNPDKDGPFTTGRPRVKPADQPWVAAQLQQGLGVRFFKYKLSKRPKICAWIRVVHEPKGPRLVFGFIDANTHAVVQVQPTDDVAAIITALLESGDFFNALDLAKAYNQLPFSDPDMLFLFEFMGEYYGPTRVPMGAADANRMLDNALHHWFGDLLLKRQLFKFSDNTYQAAVTQRLCVDKFTQLIVRAEKFRVVFGLKGAIIGAPRIAVIGYQVGLFDCGRRGWRKNEQYIIALTQLRVADTYWSIAAFCYLARYSGESAPYLELLSKPLWDLLHGKPNNAVALKKLKLPASLAPEVLACMDTVIKACDESLICSLPNPDWITFIMSDADMHCCAAVLGQWHPEELSKPVEKRQAKVLDILHSVHPKADRGRHINELETAALRKAVLKWHGLTRGMRGPLLAYTDSSTVHLRSKFEPTALVNTTMNRAFALFVHVGMILHHQSSLHNMIADIVSRTPESELKILPTRVVEVPRPSKVVHFDTISGATTTRAQTRAADEGMPKLVRPERPARMTGLRPSSADASPAASAPKPSYVKMPGSDGPTRPFRDYVTTQRNMSEEAKGVFQRKFYRNLDPSPSLNDFTLVGLREATDQNTKPMEGDMLVDGVWLRVVNEVPVIVVPNEEWKLLLTVLCHHVGGYHPGVNATLAIAKGFMYFPGMDKYIADYIRDCVVCSAAKDSRPRIRRGMSRQPYGPFSLIAMDYTDMGITSLCGKRYIFVMIDVFSLHVRAEAAESESAEFAAICANRLESEMLHIEAFTSDRGTHFLSKLWEHLCELRGWSHYTSLPFIQFTRGIIEAAIKHYANRLRVFLKSTGKRLELWPRYVSNVCAISNNSVSVTPTQMGHAPNEILFGISKPPAVVVFKPETSAFERQPLSDSVLRRMSYIQTDLMPIRAMVQEAKYLEGERTTLSVRHLLPEYRKGDLVLIAESKPLHKLIPRWDRVARIQSISFRTAVVQEVLTERTSEQHFVNIRPISAPRLNDYLNEWEMIWWGALNRLGVSSVDEFRMHDSEVECRMVFNDGRNPSWELVSDWFAEMPFYFAALFQTTACKDEAVRSALRALGIEKVTPPASE
jgi:hypothetical protein